ncbi:hypothetical protein I4641_04765 [Waterburya agarophytonicola K14]|uniref:Dicer dsRNA-binding fold domain-containing protein n=1 Tax=Waterburya agarophytonicola KI4 TaxID=2874699 RepID=A0A964BP55_9CYAN|nr:hypothetical protein [Waterburya agarophytonicola]MCC0176287.1 hypothetical protein [Waterburya agarophytonicola KI4]
MLKSLLLSSILLVSQSTKSDRTVDNFYNEGNFSNAFSPYAISPNFRELKHKLEGYGFVVNIAIPPDYQLTPQRQDFQRRRVRKPYGLLNASNKSIWINPIVFELGISQPVLIHETIHAAQFCQGKGNLQVLELDIEPIKQAQPFFKRYVNTYSQQIEREAYVVQTQTNSYELAVSLLDKYCQ